MSRTDHPRMPGTHRAWPSRRNEDWDWSGELAPRRVKAVLSAHKAIAEGLTEVHHDPHHWGPERMIESRQIEANLASGEILADLLHYDPRDPFTTNHLRRSA